MKIKDGFVLREVADSFVVMNIGGELAFNGMITLNEVGAFIWKAVENGANAEEIAKKITLEYEIDYETALSDTKVFIEKMNGVGVLEQEDLA
ncbi:MAG: PqqD family protein [Clostridia bacterium]|nr:PqqD family protein [Clostridia bacterium]